jgi:hypothetical protein
LLAAAGVLSAALGDVTEAVVIFVVVVLNAWIGFRQEYRAEKSMAALQAMATPTVSLVSGRSTNSPRRCAATIRCHRESAPACMANQTSWGWRRRSTRCSSGSNLSGAGVRAVR